MRAVIKFGGSDLSDGKKIKKAAQLVLSSNYDEKAVVVSAIGNTTDNIEELIQGTESSVGDADYAEMLSMGEMLSSRMFSSSLKSLGAKAVYFDPTQKNWPIFTDSNFTEAAVDYRKTKALVKRHIERIMNDTIPVVCGFLGKCEDGITTLGRGGSDITATLLANCLEADEVILVKDTDGVLSADPRIVRNPKSFKKLDIYELFALAHGGARVVHPRALEYKTARQRLRIVPFSSKNLSSGGTEVTGVFNPDKSILSEVKGLSALTAVGDISANNLSKFFEVLKGTSVHGISTGKRSFTIFIDGKNADAVLKRAHEENIFKAISHLKNLGAVEVTHPDFIHIHGIVAKITNLLAAKNINIIEVSTSKASIDIFLNERDVDDVKSIIGGGLEK